MGYGLFVVMGLKRGLNGYWIGYFMDSLNMKYEILHSTFMHVCDDTQKQKKRLFFVEEDKTEKHAGLTTNP